MMKKYIKIILDRILNEKISTFMGICCIVAGIIYMDTILTPILLTAGSGLIAIKDNHIGI